MKLDRMSSQRGFPTMNLSFVQAAMQTQQPQPQQPAQQMKFVPILTEVIIEYVVNGTRQTPVSTTQYKQTICDFFVSKQIQIGRFTFTISKIDAVTKNWLYLSLTKIHKMRGKMEAELLALHQEAFVSNNPRLDMSTIESCATSLRAMAKAMIRMFEKLVQLKPDVKLLKFE